MPEPQLQHVLLLAAALTDDIHAVPVTTAYFNLLCYCAIRLYIYFPSHLLCLSFFFSLPPSRISDPESHSRLFFPPSPQRFVPCIFIARESQLFLPSSTRVELSLPTLGALISSCSFFIFANKFRISPWRDSNSRTNTGSIRGLPPVHRNVLEYMLQSVRTTVFVIC